MMISIRIKSIRQLIRRLKAKIRKHLKKKKARRARVATKSPVP
jgi:hypothetical protein